MMISKELETKVRLLIAQNRKVLAIKSIIEETDCKLKEAKDFVDSLENGSAFQLSSSGSNLDSELLDLISRGKKLEAVMLCKTRTNLGLKESKDYVENLGSGSRGRNTFEQSGYSSKGVTYSSTSFNYTSDEPTPATDTDYSSAAGNPANPAARNSNSSFGNSNPATRNRDTQLDDIIKEHGIKTKSGCFIATACYGDYDSPEVVVLRQFRDQRLMNSFYGRAFVRLYYTISPPIAKQLERSEKWKRLVRVYFLAPLVNHFSGFDK